MIRGTTAQFKFSLPYDYSELSAVDVVFWQPGNSGTTESPLPIRKSLASCSPTDNPKELSVTLLLMETVRFSEKSKAYVQLRAVTSEGVCFASKQEVITVYPIYDPTSWEDLPIPEPPEDDGWVYLDGGTVG